MYSIRKIISFLPLVFILLLLLLNSCSDRSEYGTESDYEKLGAVATATETGTGLDLQLKLDQEPLRAALSVIQAATLCPESV